MRLRGVFPSLAVGLVLCTSATYSVALSLGRMTGAVFIGQALDVKVNVQWEASDAVDVSCFSTEVLHADTPQDPSKISLQLEPLAGAGTPAGVLRIRSQSLVDEPVVTVTVRGGCQSKTQRRYVLLADVASNVVGAPEVGLPVVGAVAERRAGPSSSGVPIAPASGSSSAAAAPVHAAAAREKSTSGEATKPRVPTRAARTAQEGAVLVSPDNVAKPSGKAALPLAQEATARATSRTVAPAQRSSGRARLKLDVLDLSVDYDPVLRASTELSSLPVEDPVKRAQAQLWWKQLNASPEEVLREAEQVQQLSKELTALRDLTAQNQKGLVELEARVQRAKEERYANPLVYGLAVALLLSLVALYGFWRRSGSSAQHWSEGLAEPLGFPSSELHDQDSVLVPVAELAELSEPVPPPAAAPAVDIDIDLDGAQHATPAPATVQVPAAPTSQTAQAPIPRADEVSPKFRRTHDARAVRHKDFQNSVATVMRSIDSEEVIDVREQAEFFMSLGQHDKAIEVLTSRIALCGESSPLVCLDLLRILHVLGRKADYEFMRSEFHIWFTGRVPAFGHFEETGRSLEAYPHVMKRIVALWPGTRALEFIEDCLFHQEGETDGVQFDLEAYRDLLLLHALAKRMVRTTDDLAASEPIRVPPRAKTVPEREDVNLITPRAVTHRAGAHLRGSWMRHDASEVSEVDPQAEIDTRGAPLGAMQVPPKLGQVTAQPETEKPLDVDLDSANGPVTNFDFLNVRRS